MTAFRKNINFALWARVHTLPRFFVKRWQFGQLRAVIREAYEHVPLYNELWRKKQIKPEDIRTLEDIRKLPIMSKRVFRQYSLEEAMRKDFPERYYFWNQTSGSTGEPFRFAYSPLALCTDNNDYFYSSRYRALVWRGIAFKEINTRMSFAQIGINYHPRPNFLFIHAKDLRDSPGEVMNRLANFKP